jgi:nicotinate-nucleotide--dimethylbenzimidazole phosphoribosyltransferase
MWLAARAEGLGTGWVTLFQPADLATLVGLPDGVETLGWLCLGWPDERPPEPGLVRAGWSRRLPLDDVVLHDRWPGATTAPARPVSHLRAPGPARVVGTRDEADELLTTPGSLGVLDRCVDRVLALAHPHAGRATLLLAAADHPVSAHHVSAYSPSVTREVVEATIAGRALGAVLAARAGLDVAVGDAGVDGGPVAGAVAARPAHRRGDLVGGPALHEDDAHQLLATGRDLGQTAARRYGVLALGEVGIGNTTVAAALAGLLLGASAQAVVGLGAGSDSAILDHKRAGVAEAVTRARAARDVTDPVAALVEVGGPEIAVLAGVVLGAAAGGATGVLDGLAVTVAGLVAVRLEPAAQANLVAGQRSREQGHALVLAELGLEPLLDVRLRAGEGAGAVLATQLLTTVLGARAHVARVR